MSHASRTAPAATPAIHLLDVPVHLRIAAQAGGATWDKSLKSHVFVGERLPPALSTFASRPHSLERHRELDMRGQADPVGAPSADVVLRPHQVVAAAEIVAAREAGGRGFILSDEVGLGKTFSVLSALLDLYDVETILVVCPLYAVAHWRSSIAAVGDLGKRFVVINYDRLKKLLDVPASLGPAKAGRRRKVSSLKGAVRFGTAEAFDVVVWDECQRLRNPQSGRSGLAAKLTAAASFSVWMSATAGQSPLELEYLAPLFCGRGDLSAIRSDYLGWCRSKGLSVTKGSGGRNAWLGHQDSPEGRDAKARDLATLRGLLFEGPRRVGLRRTPEDIAGWPSITRVLVPVQLPGEARQAYDLAWHVFRDHLRLAGGRKAGKRHVLTEQLRFRQKASLLRVGPTCELVVDLLETGRQVAISVAFHETLAAIRDALAAGGIRSLEMHGRQTPAANEAARMSFQTGEAPVILYTPVDAISLHQGQHNDVVRANVVHDVRWSGIEMKQVEGRTHRDGRHSVAHWMIADDTVEVKVAHAVVARIAAMATIHGDDDEADALHAMLSEL